MKVEIAGYIFLCSSATEAECLRRNLFGGRNSYFGQVKNLKKGDKLFLYNYSDKRLTGTYIATTAVKENIVPDAWSSQFPLQVKVRRISKSTPLSRGDLKDILRFNRIGFPGAKLSQEQVTAIESLFDGKERIPVYADETPYATHDGHKVRSKAEVIIDNWLYEHSILHAYESQIGDAKRCDFEIPRLTGSIYIEYWGLEDKKYLKNKEEKLKIYKKNKLELLNLLPKDLKNLNKILSKKLLT